MQNTNSQLDPQSSTYSFAHMSPEEHAEYQQYLDAQRAQFDADKGHMYPDDGDYDPSSDF